MMACLVALSPLDSPPHQDRRSIGGSSISAETKSWRHAMSRTFRAAAPRDQIEATHTHTHTQNLTAALDPFLSWSRGFQDAGRLVCFQY